MSRSLFSLVLASLVFGAWSCGSSGSSGSSAEAPEVIDLDKVLDAFHAALKVKDDEPAPAAAPAAKPAAPAAAPAAAAPAAAAPGAAAAAPGAAPAAAPAVAAAPAAKPASAEPKASADKTKKFLTNFKKELNTRKIGTKHQVGVLFMDSGVFEGYADKNKNNKKDAGEKKLFHLEVDGERKRVIATTWVNNKPYRRPRGYSLAGGLLGGYMLGRMMGRGNRYYRSRPRPNYRSMKMAPKNYRSSASKAARSSARSKGGSKGFRGGK